MKQKKECWLCNGAGFLKSYCDEPDRICPHCNGSGFDEDYEVEEDDKDSCCTSEM